MGFSREEKEETRSRGKIDGGMLIRKHTNPPADVDCARHPPSSPPRPSIAPPPPHAHYIHVRKCFIISAFVVESLRLKRKTHINERAVLAHFTPSFYLSSSLSPPLLVLHMDGFDRWSSGATTHYYWQVQVGQIHTHVHRG